MKKLAGAKNTNTIVIGAGPAGLSCAHKLVEHGLEVTVLESDPKYVGGLARTVLWKGNRFDIGGHRFFTRSPRVQSFWSNILGKEFLVRPRKSRIIYRGCYLNYPLQLGDTARKLGYRFLVSASMSYLWAKLFGPTQDSNFEQWIVKRFGKKIYHCFFKSYTEKVWGIPCSEISADWAAQRIHGLSIPAIVKSFFTKDSGATAKTLIDEFEYPRLGPGQLWEEVQKLLVHSGSKVELDRRVDLIQKTDDGYLVKTKSSSGHEEQFESSSIVSTMPLSTLCESLRPLPPKPVINAAAGLKYRDFLVVALLLDCPSPFSDQWLYVHEPKVAVGRIQNLVNWSKDLVADSTKTLLLMEYFCSSNDELWQTQDAELVSLAYKELLSLKICCAELLDATVVRTPKAYPIYNDSYTSNLSTIRRYLNEAHPNILTVGRNGMHRYNNQDHAILTGFLAADTIAGIECSESAWKVNQDAQYIEERIQPQRLGKQ